MDEQDLLSDDISDESPHMKKLNTLLDKVRDIIPFDNSNNSKTPVKTVIRNIPTRVWIVLSIHTLHSFCGFILSFNMILYLTSELGVSDINAGIYYGILAALAVLAGLPIGLINDSFGSKKTLIAGSVISLLGRIGLTMSGSVGLFFFSATFETLGSGMVELSCDVLVDRSTNSNNEIHSFAFSLLYASMNIGATLAGFATTFFMSSDYFKDIGSSTAMFSFISTLSVTIFFITLLVKEDTYIIRQESHGKTSCKECPKKCGELVKDKSFWVLLLLHLTMVGAFSMFRYMDTVLPKYLVRVYGEDIPYGSILAINPSLVIVLTPIFGMFFRNVKEMYWTIVFGCFLSSISPSIMVLWPVAESAVANIQPVVIYLIVFTIGEIIYSPRFKEYSMMLAPVDKKGLYTGLTVLPSFAGQLFSGPISGVLLKNYCPQSISTLPEILTDSSSCSELWLWVILFGLSSPFILLTCSSCLRLSVFELQARDSKLIETKTTHHDKPFDLSDADKNTIQLTDMNEEIGDYYNLS